MASGGDVSANSETTTEFVKLTASKFEWGDLSGDTVMDIGCGRELFCARTVLENFPKVKSIIALEGSEAQLQGITFQSPQIKPFLADILKRSDIRPYEGKIDKALATHVIHQITDKEKVFKNIYRLLKPEGQAAFLFTSDLGVYHILEELRLDSKYKEYYKGSDVVALYSNQFQVHHYREMLEKIGFNVLEITDEKDYIPINLFEVFTKAMLKSVNDAFSVPSELVQELKETASNIYKQKFCQQTCFYVETEMSVFVTKPSNSRNRCSSS